MPVAALISAAGTLGSAALVNHMQKKRYERELKDQQKAWQMNNAYNSPSQQMARLKSAGLNPNLVYMNGGTSATSDTMTTPSFDSAPIADFTPAAQLLQQSPTLAANIRKINAETATIESENRDRFSPLSKLYNFDQQEREYFARAYGFNSPDDVDNLTINRVGLLSELKHKTQDSKNLSEVFKILNNNVGSAENDAYTAAFVRMLTEMEFYSEAKKRGYGLQQNEGKFGLNYSTQHPSSMWSIFKNDKQLDYVAEMFLRQYKEIHWESTDAKHILDQFHQFMHDIPSIGSLRRGKPTIRGIERSGYDRNRGSWYTYDRYDYGK